ncbi:MAG: hypothetical protein GY854_22855 [Deltaproteobacteria bacterium]|nr:hypothetical protein [Deltaproteobacteria bacterium]
MMGLAAEKWDCELVITLVDWRSKKALCDADDEALARREELAAVGRVNNLRQVSLVIFGLVALGILVAGVVWALSTVPGEDNRELGWYISRFSGALPTAWIVSVPSWIWYAVSLCWVLLLSRFAQRGARWAWGAWIAGGIWARSETSIIPSSKSTTG